MESEGRAHTGVGSKFHGFRVKTRRSRLISIPLGLGLLGIAFAQPAVLPRREITLTAQAVPLNTAGPNTVEAGALRYLGGLWLRSEDRGFGGLSGLIAEENQGVVEIVAVTDQGGRFTARLGVEAGQLRGVLSATIEPLRDLYGVPVSGKSWGDAESITRLPDGRVLVGFERRHRIWTYGPEFEGPATTFATPPALLSASSNGGLESIAAWPDGRILAITERLKTPAGQTAAFLFTKGAWTTLEWKASAKGFEPSDATVLPGGDLLVLERFWSPLAPMDPRSRILRVKGASVVAGATLEGELVAELKAPLIAGNFEGITAFKGPRGVTRLLLVSDNNFSALQRTLLLLFELRD